MTLICEDGDDRALPERSPLREVRLVHGTGYVGDDGSRESVAASDEARGVPGDAEGRAAPVPEQRPSVARAELIEAQDAVSHAFEAGVAWGMALEAGVDFAGRGRAATRAMQRALGLVRRLAK